MGLVVIQSSLSSPLFLLLPIIYAVFGLDPASFLVERIFRNQFLNQGLLTKLIRTLLTPFLCSCCTLSIVRNMCFMYIYFYETIQAYQFICKLIAKIGDAQDILKNYNKLNAIHRVSAPFANRAILMSMFMAHACCVFMFWIFIRGRDMMPDYLLRTFFFTGVCDLCWVFLILKVYSKIKENSAAIIYELKKEVIGKTKSRDRTLLKYEIACLVPLKFYGGGWFEVTRDSPGNFVNTVLDNVVSAVLAI